MTACLWPLLKATAEKYGDVTLTQVSAGASDKGGPTVDAANLNNPYPPHGLMLYLAPYVLGGSTRHWARYGHSKLANVLFAEELNRRVKTAGLGDKVKIQFLPSGLGWLPTHPACEGGAEPMDLIEGRILQGPKRVQTAKHLGWVGCGSTSPLMAALGESHLFLTAGSRMWLIWRLFIFLRILRRHPCFFRCKTWWLGNVQKGVPGWEHHGSLSLGTLRISGNMDIYGLQDTEFTNQTKLCYKFSLVSEFTIYWKTDTLPPNFPASQNSPKRWYLTFTSTQLVIIRWPVVAKNKRVFYVHPDPWGKTNPIWRYNIFQWGWFNHQLLLMEEIVHHLGCVKPCK